MTRSRRASSSLPSCSTSASLRCAAALGRLAEPPDAARTGFRFRVVGAVPSATPVAAASRGVVVGRFVVAVMVVPFSDVQVDGSGGRVDTGLDELAHVTVDLAGAQVADLARDEWDEAAAADAHAASARPDDAAVLAGFEEGDVAARLHLLVGLLERQQPALAAGALEQDGSEALDREARVGRVVAVALPQLGGRVEEVGGSAGVCRPLAPVVTERLEVGDVRQVEAPAALLAREPVADREAGELVGELEQLVVEERVVTGARRVDEDDVGVGP